MSTIPTSLTENQFDQHVRPYISVAKRGFESKIELYKVFNYVLKKLYTGCQWKEVSIVPDLDDPEKKGNQLACRLLPLSQVEPRWQSRKNLARQHHDDSSGFEFI